MTYSSALFSGQPGQTLEQAQHAKYSRILQQLQVADGARLLEIGCGWGGFAELAIRQQQAHVTVSRRCHQNNCSLPRNAGHAPAWPPTPHCN